MSHLLSRGVPPIAPRDRAGQVAFARRLPAQGRSGNSCNLLSKGLLHLNLMTPNPSCEYCQEEIDDSLDVCSRCGSDQLRETPVKVVSFVGLAVLVLITIALN